MKTTISFTLDTERDRDLLRWLNGLPKRERSKAIREALRTNLGRGGVTLDDVYQAVLALRQSGMVVADSRDVADDEPPDIVGNLDRLGL